MLRADKGGIILCTPSSTVFSDKQQMRLLKSVHTAVTTLNETLLSIAKILTAQSNYLDLRKIILYLPGYAWYNRDCIWPVFCSWV